MSGQMLFVLFAIVGLGVISAFALLDVGYLGIIAPHFQTWGGLQVFVDLVILALLACAWMVQDARKQGLPAWPFILVTLGFGSFGPLFYLVFRAWRGTHAESAA